jgi:hypothetical protein
VTQDVEVAPPEPEEIDRLARELRDRVRDATAALTSAHPVAKPAAETCRFCSVRHLCEDYWRAVERPLKSGAADIEVEVVARNGPRSWLVRTQAEEEGILRTSESDDLREGRRQRLLGAFISPTEGDDEPLTISLSANTETYLLREDGAV